MGILSMSRNLLSKHMKPISDMRRIFFPTVVKHKPMFLIEHDFDSMTNYSLLSVADASENNNNSWKHHHHSICTPGKCNRLIGSCKEWILFWSFKEEVEFEHSDLVLVDKIGDSSFRQSQGRLSLWNPTTNRIKTLLPSSLPRAPHPQQHVFYIDTDRFGFGFDPKSQDYKLICFTVSDYNWKVDIELYSIKTDSWKQITAPPDVHGMFNKLRNFISDFRLYSVHINGVHYWATSNAAILSFDFADETLSRIPLPDAHHIRKRLSDYCLAEFDESLAMIVPYWVPDQDLTDEEKQKQLKQPFSVEIWVWNGKTWNVGPRVAVGDFPVGDSIGRVLGLFQNEYLFLQGCNEPELMLFNCKTGKLENLGIQHRAPKSTTPVRRPGIFPYTVPI